MDGAFVTNAVDQRLHCGLAAKSGLHQMDQFNPKVVDINALGQNQAQVQGQLKPATGKNKIGQASSALMGQVVLHDERGGLGFVDAIVLYFECPPWRFGDLDQIITS